MQPSGSRNTSFRAGPLALDRAPAERPPPAADTEARLSAAELAAAAVALVYPFRVLVNDALDVDLHLGLVSFAVLCVVALATVRRLPAGFPGVLDAAVLLFLAVAAVELLVVSGLGDRQAIKGFAVEVRFALFYLIARVLGLGRRFGEWLLGAILALGLAAAVVGVVEYHFSWGALLDLVDTPPDRRFWKTGVPRLYSFAMTPLGAAFFLDLAVAAAAFFFAVRRRSWLVAAGLVAVWQALPLTLARTGFAIAVAIHLGFLVLFRDRALRFAAITALALAGAALSFSARGLDRPLAQYAAVGGKLADRSAESHRKSTKSGRTIIAENPLGLGFGQAGHLAMLRGGAFRHDDTYYVTLGVQAGMPGLAAFGAVVAASALVWGRETASRERRRRAFGFAGLSIWFTLAFGSLFVAAWTMLAPQLYFWLLTGVAANAAAGAREEAA